jgi:hypothetical protein
MAHVQREQLRGGERASCIGVGEDWAAESVAVSY